MSDKRHLPKTKTKEKLMAEIDRKFPGFTNLQMNRLIVDLTDLTEVFKKVATEPQIDFTSKDIYTKKRHKGKRRKTGEKRLYTLNLVERLTVKDEIDPKLEKENDGEK